MLLLENDKFHIEKSYFDENGEKSPIFLWDSNT